MDEDKRSQLVALARAEADSRRNQELRARAVSAVATACQNVNEFNVGAYLHACQRVFRYLKSGDLTQPDDLPPV